MNPGKMEPSTCKLCGKSFADEDELVSHEVTVHPNVNGLSEVGRPAETNREAGLDN